MNQCVNWRNQLLRHYDSTFGIRPIDESREDTALWFASQAGQRVLNQQKLLLGQLLPELFGYHLMQMSVQDDSLFSETSTSHQFFLLPSLSASTKVLTKKSSVLVSDFEHLAIDSDSIDVALLHHALDYSINPQQLLRETVRATIPNGHIIIVGFNPFSLMGVTSPLACLVSTSSRWRHQQLRVSRLIDWFRLLGVEVLSCHREYYNLPTYRYYSSMLESIGKNIIPIAGGFYVLLARKNVIPMTPIKKRWRDKKVLPTWGQGVVSSKVSSSSHHSQSKINRINVKLEK